MRIKVTSDSTCDLSAELVEKYNITLVPLLVEMGGKSYRDGVDIVPADIFAHVAAGGGLCSTAAVNMVTYHEIFEPLSHEYDAVIHVNIGSGFSSCYQNACLAAQDLPNVYVIDSRNLSTGQGLIVLEACERAQNCEDAAALAEELCKLTARVEASFVLHRLDYMVKGGRCSMVTALGANLLKLRPCIEVKDGKMAVVKKYRGTYDKCLRDYIRDRLADRDDVEKDKLFFTYTPVEEKAMAEARKALKTYSQFDRVFETTAGCTVSCHCGPDTLGVLFIRKA